MEGRWSETKVTKCDMGRREFARKVMSLSYIFLYIQTCYFPICIHGHWPNLSLSCNSFIYEPVKIKDNFCEKSKFKFTLRLLGKVFFRTTFVPKMEFIVSNVYFHHFIIYERLPY